MTTRRIVDIAAALLAIVALCCAVSLVALSQVGMRGPAAMLVMLGASCSVLAVLLVCETSRGER